MPISRAEYVDLWISHHLEFVDQRDLPLYKYQLCKGPILVVSKGEDNGFGVVLDVLGDFLMN